MKFFRRKSAPKPSSRNVSAAAPSRSEFYTRSTSESPLDEGLESGDFQQIRRTSRHAPAARREGNRSEKQAFLLLFRIVLIVVLLVAGFIALKIGLGGLQEPTEKEMQASAEKEMLMEQELSVDEGLARALQEDSGDLDLTSALLEERLTHWRKANQFLRTAEGLYRSGIHEEAVRQLKLALRVTPANTAVQKLLLNISMGTGAYEEAIPLCLLLLEKTPMEWDLQKNLLAALEQTGRLESTLLLAENMLQVQPNDLLVLETAARAYLANNQLPLAEERFARILDTDRMHEGALEGVGQICRDLGRWEDAIPYYSTLVRIAPQAEYYHALAACYAQKNEAGKAVLLMGQAGSLYGHPVVSGWFADAEFDPVRETVEFRSYTDQIVGAERRRAIEAIRQREKEKETLEMPGVEAPVAPALQLKPTN